MATFLDLPDEIRLLIGKQLHATSIYALIRVCRSSYSSFIPCLWSTLSIVRYKGDAVPAGVVHTNAHRIEAITFSATVTREYYAIAYPRLTKLQMMTFYSDKKEANYLQVQPQEKLDFARRHPFITVFRYHHKDTLPREFWEVVETVWRRLDVLDFSGVIDADAVDSFWRVCERVQTLNLQDVDFPSESLAILSTLSFPRLKDLTILKYFRQHPPLRQLWHVQLLERAKGSEHLKRIEWSVDDVVFPVQIVLDAFAEDCWPNLSGLSIAGGICSDQDVAAVLRRMISRQLTDFELWSGTFGPKTYKCLNEVHFSHLRDIRIRLIPGATSAMVQEILTECVHLVRLDAPHVFVRDIVTSSRPWGCLRLQTLVVCIAKQVDDEAEWEKRVFEQIGKLKRMVILDLQRNPYSFDQALHTLNLSGSVSSNDSSPADDFVATGSGGIRSWSGLLQLKEFSFDGDRQWMGVKELEWMIEHWKELTYITGDFRAAAGSSDDERIKQLLGQHKIVHSQDTHPWDE
ncbi:hypothetical protein BGZ96_010534 [Linnemannia gamsii]|uniref:F-box domain-containing protein n=1 Tax=Linnemannia gamsii TaxID=64522 RepID=A0ABQ7JUT8_9FUNG|nr:hypothetical protein BGZ96_010534 [Linnemannia gamsii]